MGRFPPHQCREEGLTLLRAGSSVSEVHRRLGVPRSTVQEWARGLGLAAAPGRPRGARAPRTPGMQVQAQIQALAEDQDPAAIAQALGIKRKTVLATGKRHAAAIAAIRAEMPSDGE